MAARNNHSAGRKSSGTKKTTASKKSTASEKTAAKKSTAAKSKSPANKKSGGSQEFPWGREVLLFVILAVSILLFIGNLGKGGPVGGTVSAFFFGVFGILSYGFPVVFFLVSAFLISNKRERGRAAYSGRVIMKTVAGILLFLFLCVFSHLIVYGKDPVRLADAYAVSAEQKNGGGIVGAAVCELLSRAFGIAGAYVIVAVVLVLCVVLLTEHSLFRDISRGTRKVYESARADAQRRKEQTVQRREERTIRRREVRESRRTDHKADGVTENTKLFPQAGKASDNLSELNLRGTDTGSRKEEAIRMDLAEGSGTGETAVQGNISGEGETGRFAVQTDAAPSVQGYISGTMETGRSGYQAGDLSPSQGETSGGMNAGRFTDQAGASPLAREDQAGAGDGIPQPDIHITQPASELTDRHGNQDTAFSADTYARSDKDETLGTDRVESDSSGQELRTAAEGPEKPGRDGPERSEMTEYGTVFPPDEPQDGSAHKRGRRAKQDEQEVATEVSGIDREIRAAAVPVRNYIFPDISLLKRGDPRAAGDSLEHLQETSAKLQNTLTNFGVNARVTNVTCGPTVTQYEVQPEMGVKVSKILSLADDIKLNLAVADIRIEAPIPGKAAIGIEVPNREQVTVSLRELIESQEFRNHPSRLAFCAGKDIAGHVIVADIAKMPHLLIAGATGSGKSVCINTIVMSILYKADPEDVKLIMIDPKVVELSVYNGIPHLFIPVVTDPKKAAGALHWAVAEMTDRYQKFAACGVRDIKGYNKKAEESPESADMKKMPQIVIIVDELADLMMVAPGDVEDAICRLAQLARAAGIHLIIATQRPSVNVITGLIKANMPSRIAFSVSSGVDSRTILDMNGAEKLLGKGDMLFYPQGYQKPLRVQGAFVSDSEVSDVVEYIIEKNEQVSYSPDIEEKVVSTESPLSGSGGNASPADDRDAYFTEAGRFLIEKEKGSIGMLQRMFKIGFNRAARIMDQLEKAGVVSPEEGTKPRRVLMTMEEFEHLDQEGIQE